MLKVNKTVISIAIVMMLVVVSLGTSYAYLTDDLSGSVSLQVLENSKGKMVLGFQGNNDTFGLSKISPSSGVVGTKTFSITGTNNYNDDAMSYNLSLIVNYNDFETSDLYFILGGKLEDGSGSLTPMADTLTKHYLNRVLDNGVKIDLGNGFFINSKEETHTYMISFYYPETNYNKSRNDRSLSVKVLFTNLNS